VPFEDPGAMSAKRVVWERGDLNCSSSIFLKKKTADYSGKYLNI
jgi:hypothetical protein